MLTGKADSNRYWELVRRTLKDVFSRDPSIADSLENEVRNSAQDEEELFYHSEPLSTAAEIAGEQLAPGDIDTYKKLRADVYGIP